MHNSNIRRGEPLFTQVGGASYEHAPILVRNIVADGAEKAQKLAQQTLRDVRGVMGLDYA